jgi:hypothetical protein
MVGIHDQPYAKALCLQNDQVTLIILTLDMGNLTAEAVAKIRGRVHRATGTPEDHILISYSHTHSGPPQFVPRHLVWLERMMQMRGDWQDIPQWTNLLVRVIASAAIEAWRQRQPARLGFGRGEATGISFNRRRGDEGALDTEVMVLLATDLNDVPLAVLVNFGCHPVVLRHDTLLYTADYPWAMMELVEAVYPGAVAMFAQGAAGNVGPLRHFWWRLDDARRFDNAERMGRILGAEAVKVVNRILLRGCQSDVSLAAASTVVPLPQEEQPTLEEAEILIGTVQNEIAEAQARLDSHIATHGDHPEDQRQMFTGHVVGRAQASLVWAEAMRDMARKGEVVPQRQCEVQVMRLGDARLVSMAGEVFNELGQEVKDALGRGSTFFLGYANGECGYIPTPDSFAEGGHEIVFTQRMMGLCLLPEAGPLLVREAVALARTI